jgi:hypothetical protein
MSWPGFDIAVGKAMAARAKIVADWRASQGYELARLVAENAKGRAIRRMILDRRMTGNVKRI